MKKHHKQRLKKGIYIAILIVFTTVSILPAASILTDNDTNTGLPTNEESIKELFGENATYDPRTGTITYTDESENVNKK